MKTKCLIKEILHNIFIDAPCFIWYVWILITTAVLLTIMVDTRIGWIIFLILFLAMSLILIIWWTLSYIDYLKNKC